MWLACPPNSAFKGYWLTIAWNLGDICLTLGTGSNIILAIGMAIGRKWRFMNSSRVDFRNSMSMENEIMSKACAFGTSLVLFLALISLTHASNCTEKVEGGVPCDGIEQHVSCPGFLCVYGVSEWFHVDEGLKNRVKDRVGTVCTDYTFCYSMAFQVPSLTCQ